MADILKLKLQIEDDQAFIEINKLKAALDSLSKSKKVDSSAFKAYREQAALASTLTTRLGRELDSLNGKYGYGSAEVNKFVQANLKSNAVQQIQAKAITNLKKAYADGAISLAKYQNEMQKVVSTQSLFQNKLKMETPIRKIQVSLNSLQTVMSTINPQLGVLVTRFSQFKDAAESVAGKGSTVGGFFASIQSAITGINPVTVAAVGVLGTFAAGLATAGAEAKKTIPIYAEYGKSLNTLAALGNLSAGQQEKFSLQIEELARVTPEFDAQALAQSLIQIQKAGVGGSAGLALLETNIEAAIATGQDLTATNIQSISALKSLGLETSNAADLNNKFAAVANSSNSVFGDYSEIMAAIGAQVQALKQPHDEVVASIGVLKDNGLETSTVMTNLRQIYLGLIKPTKSAQQEFDKYGVSLIDAAGNAKPLSSVLRDLKGSISGLSSPQQAQVISKMFEKRAVSAVLTLMRNVDGSFKDLTETAAKASQEDTLGGMAEKMRRGYENARLALESLRSSIDITIGKNVIQFSTLEDSTRSVTQTLTQMAQAGQFASFGQNIGAIIKPFTDLKVNLTELTARFKMFVVQIAAIFNPLTTIFVQLFDGAVGAINNFLEFLNIILQPIASLANQLAGATSMTEAFEVAITTLGAAMLAAPFGPLAQLIAGVGVAMMSLIPTSEELQNSIGTMMSNSVDVVQNGSDELRGILDALKSDAILSVEQITTVWESGALNWYQKTAIVLKGLITDFPTTFSYLTNVTVTFFAKLALSVEQALLNIANSFANFISKIPGIGKPLALNVKAGIDGSLGAQVKGLEGFVAGKELRAQRLRAKVVNTSFSRFAEQKAPSIGTRIPSSVPFGSGSAGEEDSSGLASSANKAKEKAEREAAKAKKEAEKLAKQEEKIEDLEEKARLAEKELQSTLSLIEAKEDLAIIEDKILKAKKTEGQAELARDEVDYQIQRQKENIELLYKKGMINEQQKIGMEQQVDLQKIDLEYERQMAQIGQENLELEKLQAELSGIKSEEKAKEAAAVEKLLSAQIELENLQQKAAGATTSEAKNEIREETAKLQETIAKLKESLAELQSGASDKIRDASNKIKSKESDIELAGTKAEQERSQAVEALQRGTAAAMDEANEKTLDTFAQAGKEIFNSITSAWSDGKITAEEMAGILQQSLEKLADLFSNKGGGGFGALLAGAGGITGGFGGLGGNNFLGGGNPLTGGLGAGQQWERDTQGFWQIIDSTGKQLTNLDKSCLKAAKQASGLGGELGGLGGIFQGLMGGGAGGLSALGGIASGALSIGSSIFGGIMSARKARKQRRAEEKKREENFRKWQNEFKFELNIDNINRSFEKFVDNMNRSFSRIDRAISKLNTQESIFQGQEAIAATLGKISSINQAIAQARDAAAQKINAYTQQVKTIWTVVLQSGTTVWDDYQWSQRQKMDEITQKTIPEISRTLEQQIIDFQAQQQALRDEIGDLKELQKGIFLKWRKETDKAKLGVQYGDIGESLFDQMNSTLDQIREVMLAGLDPETTKFLIARLRQTAKDKMQEEYQSFVENSSNNYLDEIRSIQDDFYSVISEGRATGQIKRTKEEKLAEIQARLERVQAQQETDQATLNLADFGYALEDFTTAIDAVTAKLDERLLQMTNEFQIGQFREIDPININTIFDPARLASIIQKEILIQTSSPVLATTTRI